MKRTLSLAAIIAFVALGMICLAGCKEHSNEVDVNIINYKGTSFSIAKGYKHRVAELKKKGLWEYRVYILGHGVELDIQENGPVPTGEGALITFTVFSQSGSDISMGEYPINGYGYIEHDTITAENCQIKLNYNFSTNEGEVYDINWGSFKFFNLGNNIKIKVNLQDKLYIPEYTYDTIVNFKGYFYGTLEDLNRFI